MFLIKKANIKIESAVSSGSNWNYMKNVNYLWSLVVAAQALHSSGCYCLLKKLSSYPEFSYVHQIIQLCPKHVLRWFMIKIVFTMTINKSQADLIIP